MESDPGEILPPRGQRPQSHGSASGATDPVFAPFAHFLVLAGAAGAVFLAGGAPQGSLGIFLLCAGVALVFCPPGARVDGWLWLIVAALVLCASLAFLPAHWLPIPAWRKDLEALPVVPSVSTITPVPWQTAFWLALLGLTACTLLFLLAHPLRSGTLRGLALMAGLVCGIYAALAIYARATGWHYPFDGGATFGFFPNRNHTASFLITGSILSMGVVGVALRDDHWPTAILAAGSLAVCIVSLFFYSGSRAGIAFLLVGTLLWIIGLGRAHRPGRLLVSSLALLAAGGVLFATSGGEARTRLAALFEPRSPTPAPPTAAPSAPVNSPNAVLPSLNEKPFDGRVLIYKDTLPLIRSLPLTGTGLGAFALVFPQYRDVSLSESPAVHPESDWLMLGAEAGLPALFCAVGLLWRLVQRLPPFKAHPYWPLRWGVAAAAAAALLHGLIDVPAHRVPLGWWIMAVAGLGLQPGRTKSPGRCRMQHAVFVLGGIIMLVLGTRLIRSEWFGASPLPPFAAQRQQAEVVRAYERHDIDGAVRMIRQAILASPWDELMYYQLGAFELPFADSDAEVDAAFKAERVLNPGSPAVPLRQGTAWLAYDGPRAAALWLDAFARRRRLDRLAGAPPEATVDFYRDLLRRAAKWPDVQQALLAAAQDRPALLLAWLENVPPELVRQQLGSWAKEGLIPQRLDAGERRRLLLAWYAAGDWPGLTQFVDEHADWQNAAWPVRVRQWVDAREFERVVHEAADHYRISLALPEVVPQENYALRPTQEPEDADPIVAFNAHWRRGNFVSARRVLDEAAKGTGPSPVRSEVWRLKAADAAQRSDWAAAWQNLRLCIQADYGEEAL